MRHLFFSLLCLAIASGSTAQFIGPPEDRNLLPTSVLQLEADPDPLTEQQTARLNDSLARCYLMGSISENEYRKQFHVYRGYTFLGTGLLLKDEGLHYLITAAHLLGHDPDSVARINAFAIHARQFTGAFAVGSADRNFDQDSTSTPSLFIHLPNNPAWQTSRQYVGALRSQAYFIDSTNDLILIRLEYFGQGLITRLESQGYEFASINTLDTTQIFPGEPVSTYGFPVKGRTDLAPRTISAVSDTRHGSTSSMISADGVISQYRFKQSSITSRMDVYPGSSGSPLWRNGLIIGIIRQRFTAEADPSIYASPQVIYSIATPSAFIFRLLERARMIARP